MARISLDKRDWREQLVTLLLWTVAALVAFIPLLMVTDLLSQGWQHLSWQFLVESPRQGGREGGIAPLLASTGLLLLITLAVVIPLGLGCALFLSEVAGPKAQQRLGLVLDVLAGVPSVVFGLFGYLFFAQLLGLGFSLLSGGLSLACMALPLFVRLSEQALRRSARQHRQAAIALGLSLGGFIRRILLPGAAGGIAAATIIAIGRTLAETAVLLFTAGYVTRYPQSLLDSGRALSVHIYDLAMNVPGGAPASAATALVLVGLLVMINLLTRRVSRRWIAR